MGGDTFVIKLEDGQTFFSVTPIHVYSVIKGLVIEEPFLITTNPRKDPPKIFRQNILQTYNYFYCILIILLFILKIFVNKPFEK